MNVSGGWSSASVAGEPGSGSGVSVWVLWWTEESCSQLVSQYLSCSFPPLVLFCVDTVVPCRGHSSHKQCLGATTANNTFAFYAVVNTGTRRVHLCTGTWFVAFYPLCMADHMVTFTFIQGYWKWLSGYNCPAAIPHQIRETTIIWQFHSKVVCTVSRDRVLVYPGTEGTNQNLHWNHHRWQATIIVYINK